MRTPARCAAPGPRFFAPSINRDRILLLAVGVGLYLPGVMWGLPIADRPGTADVWAPDDISPLAALTEVHNALMGGGPDRYLAYPLCHHFLLAAVYAPYLVWLWLTGGFSNPTPTFPFGFADPVAAFRTLTLIARAVSIAMAALVGVFAFETGRTLWDRRTGLLAAAVCLSSYPMFYYSKTGNLDVPALFWTSIGLLVYARMLRDGITPRRAAWLGVFAALAAATKDQAAGFFVLLPLIGVPGASRWRRTGRTVLALILTGAATYAVASGLAVDPDRYVAHVHYLFSDKRELISAPYVSSHPLSPLGFVQLAGSLGGALIRFLGPALVAVGLVALVDTARRERWTIAYALPAATYVLTFLFPLSHFRLRFALPVAFTLGIFAGRGVRRVLDRISSRMARVLIVACLLAWPMALAFDLVYQMRHDARYRATAWLARHARPGQTLAHFGPMGELPHVTGWGPHRSAAGRSPRGRRPATTPAGPDRDPS